MWKIQRGLLRPHKFKESDNINNTIGRKDKQVYKAQIHLLHYGFLDLSSYSSSTVGHCCIFIYLFLIRFFFESLVTLYMIEIDSSNVYRQLKNSSMCIPIAKCQDIVTKYITNLAFYIMDIFLLHL